MPERPASLSAHSSLWLAAMSVTLVLVGCAPNEQHTSPEEAASTPPPDTTTRSVTDDTIQGTGTIRYVDLEGGFYGLVASDGTKYDPTPLPDSLQVDDLSVRFRVEEKDTMTTRMWGSPVEVIEIERIDDENE